MKIGRQQTSAFSGSMRRSFLCVAPYTVFGAPVCQRFEKEKRVFRPSVSALSPYHEPLTRGVKIVGPPMAVLLFARRF
jgi:hypothetical protein